ncbi:MAG: hypothetical protein E6G49_09945 [Actinobacteria bacterium]|nr:MAG: hypothetical protein E6G49_09945 [Actinomycetota bacterium]
MRYLRRISTRRLLAICGAVGLVAIASAAIALAATGGGPTPPPKPLPVAVHDALSAPGVAGISARVQFTDNLLPGSGVQGSDPLLTGGSGRLWASSDGKLRLELQSDSGRGDSQVVIDGRRFLVYSGDTATAYRGRLPTGRGGKNNSDAGTDRVPSIARIHRGLSTFARHLDLSGAMPTDVAGRPAYSVRISPKSHGGLIGGLQLAWDAIHGVPLEASVYAHGVASPVLQLRATDISFGPVSDSVFAISPPPGTKVTNIDPPSRHPAGRGSRPAVTGAAAVARRVSFRLNAHSSLAGMQREEVRMVNLGDSRAALVTYGHGLGGIAVLERASSGRSGPSRHGMGDLTLPTLSIGGVSGEELKTPLGTVIDFNRQGVEYVVAGSVPTAVAEGAARGL